MSETPKPNVDLRTDVLKDDEAKGSDAAAKDAAHEGAGSEKDSATLAPEEGATTGTHAPDLAKTDAVAEKGVDSEEAARETERVEGKNEVPERLSVGSVDAPKSTSQASQPPPHRRTGTLDLVMRGLVMVALGVFITVPLWGPSIPFWPPSNPEGSREATQFRADRSEENTTEGKLMRVIGGVIRTAAADQEVDEVATARELASILQEAELGDRQQRADATNELVANILAQAAETSSLGFSQFQNQAIDGQSRIMARTLITRLGGQIDNSVDDDIEGDWTPAPWPVLSGFEYEEGMELPAPVRALDGQDVMAWGYLLYLEDDQFLLVQSLWSCCFGQPPDLHEAIVIRADPENRRHESQGVRVYGRFEASELTEDGYVTSLYRLDSRHLRPM